MWRNLKGNSGESSKDQTQGEETKRVRANRPHLYQNCGHHRRSGSEKVVFWKRGLFRKVHFLEILEILEILENRQTGKRRKVRPFSRDFGENI